MAEGEDRPEVDIWLMGGTSGGWHRSGVVPFSFLVLSTARGAAGRAFPVLLRERAHERRRCQFSVIFAGAADTREKAVRSVGRSPFFQPRWVTFFVAPGRLLASRGDSVVIPPNA